MTRVNRPCLVDFSLNFSAPGIALLCCGQGLKDTIIIVRKCSFPLTGKNCVNLVVTDLAVIELTTEGLLLKEIAPGWTVEEVQALTEPKLIVAKDVKEMEL